MNEHIKRSVAEQAARIMALEGVEDYRIARKKAVQRLGIQDKKNLPDEKDITAALDAYHRLFHGKDQPMHLAGLRELALEALHFFQDFSPRVVGGVWEGTAGRFSPILIHLFPATPEEVMHKLWAANIAFEENNTTQAEARPVLSFYLNGTRVELWIFASAFKTTSKKARATGGALNQLEALIRSVTTAN